MKINTTNLIKIIAFSICLSLFVFSSCKKNNTDKNNNSSNKTEWVLDFQDDFNENKLNENVWAIYDNSWHDIYEPDKDHTDHMRRREAVQVQDGYLNLLVDRHPINPKRFMTGGIAHKKNYLYGKFEFRVRIDADSHLSTSGVVLTWPESEKWPNDGEIDIYETHHTDNYWSSWVHWGVLKNDKWEDQKHQKSYTFDKTQWHIIAMEWTDKFIKIYINGDLVWTMKDPMAITKNPHHICFQTEKDSKKGFTKPIKMQVDWVKIYQKK